MSRLEVAAPESVRFRAPEGLVLESVAEGAEGNLVLSFPLVRRPSFGQRLTPVEWELLGDLAHGLSNGEIARRRGVSIRTVANQMSQLFRKLGVHSRLDAALVAGHWAPPAAQARSD
jgi:two-component system nitrate/nitrite response regulator NarL